MRMICRLSLVWLRMSCHSHCEGCIKEESAVQLLPALNDNPRPKHLTVGYARVSTADQRLDLQVDALRTAGCDVIYRDVASGDDVNRKGLQRALADCLEGDILVVWKLDRLCRDLFALVEIMRSLRSRGVGLRLITGGGGSIHSATAEGRLVMGVLACVAEFELELVRERTRAGMQSALQRLGLSKVVVSRGWLSDAFNSESEALAACESRCC